MERRVLTSSTLKAVSYDPIERALTVEFHSGGTYRYAAVPEEVVLNLLRASSHGAYFHLHVKPFYAVTKVQSAPAAPEAKGAGDGAEG